MTLVIAFSLAGCIDLDALRPLQAPIADAAQADAEAADAGGGIPDTFIAQSPDAGAPPVSADAGPEPVCGVVGRACCESNRCDTGACLRGTCSAFGGIHGRTDACAPSCRLRNGYTAGCSCPYGFHELAVPLLVTMCDGETMGPGDLAFCRAAPGARDDLTGFYLTASPLGSCSGGCLVPDETTGACACAAGTSAIELDTSFGGACGTQSAKLVLCASMTVPATTFGGAFQRDRGGACSVPNPRTGSCACPEGATEQTVPGDPGFSFCLH
jgi:hypothetical protein